MMFGLNLQRILLVLLLVLLSNSLKIKEGMKGFEKEKNKIEKKMNAMRLGNYLRRLMLKNNHLIGHNMIFLENRDFTLENEDINYTDMNTDGENDVDFKSRVYALKWIKVNSPRNNFKPFSVSSDSKEKVKGWNIQNVLLLGNNDKTKVIKICFPNNLEENFAIVTLLNKQCTPRIKKIDEYKMFDNFSYMSHGKSADETIEEEKPKTEVKLNDEIKNKQMELIKASKNQHFKQNDLNESKKKSNKNVNESSKVSDEEKITIHD